MAAEDKIKIFDSVDSLITEINNDSATSKIISNRYPVRFIMFDNFNEFQNLLMKLVELNIRIFGLDSLLPETNKDVWISNDELSDAIKNLQVSSIIVPFSEIVRFYDNDNFNAIFYGLSKMENNNKNTCRRLYVPLIGLHHRFCNFLESVTKTTEIAPVWAVKTEHKYSVDVFLTQKNIQHSVNEYRGIETMYDWLQFWKTNPTPEKVVCSSLSIIDYADNSQPDNIFTPIKISSAYDFIEKYHNLFLNIPYIETEEKYWQQLLYHISNNNFSFKSFVETQIDVGIISIKKLLNKWTATDTTEFDRWLLKYYYLQFIVENEYLNCIMLDSVDYSALRLFREIALSIFVYTSVQSQIEERNTLLKLFDRQYKLPEADLLQMKEQILEISKTDTTKAISLCSGRFDFEKELFIGWYKVGKLKITDLEKLYPDFAAYLSNRHCGLDPQYPEYWANNYIQAYKQAKVNDTYTDEIKNIIAEKNTNEANFYDWYHKFESSKELLAKAAVDKLYWIDGLGIEYLSLISEIIGKSNFQIEKLKIAKTGIPSSTEHNSFENVTKLDDLDKFIHSEQYKYPSSICREIEIVKEIFNKILTQSAET
ncbi:MAG: BREX-4 system phosphatase PglZ, partial [Bacteroidales bacterium]|nr:BREX-4 system phosphatase PglZ [Bacteroidales bacterium]